MLDDLLSQAVVTYVWGVPARAWPSRDAASVRSRYGGAADGLLAHIASVFDLVDATEVDWSVEDLAAAADRIDALLSSTHPELNRAAVQAIGAEFTYRWR